MGIAHNLLGALGATVLALTSSAPALAVELVEFHEEAKAGTIVKISPKHRRLGHLQAVKSRFIVVKAIRRMTFDASP